MNGTFKKVTKKWLCIALALMLIMPISGKFPPLQHVKAFDGYSNSLHRKGFIHVCHYSQKPKGNADYDCHG